MLKRFLNRQLIHLCRAGSTLTDREQFLCHKYNMLKFILKIFISYAIGTTDLSFASGQNHQWSAALQYLSSYQQLLDFAISITGELAKETILIYSIGFFRCL